VKKSGISITIAATALVCLAAHGAFAGVGASTRPAIHSTKPAASAQKPAPTSKSGVKPAASVSKSKPAATKTATRPATRVAPTKARYSSAAARARHAKINRARALARARAAREAPIPRFKLDDHGELVPDLRAAAAIVYNPETHQVLWEHNGQAQRSIASITKVMTAIVFLETEPDLNRQVVVERSDVQRASVTYLRTNEVVTVDDLLHLLLIASDNAAARVIARISPWGAEGFITRMNEKARDLGLASTRYADPSGLSADNVSSAYDMALLIAYAAGDERISGLMRKADHLVVTSRRRVTIHNTNQLVKRTDMDVRGGKTGFISSSGYCLATLLRLPEIDQKVAVVVLGARSNTGRFNETRNLFSWLSTKAQDLFGRRARNQDPNSEVDSRQ